MSDIGPKQQQLNEPVLIYYVTNSLITANRQKVYNLYKTLHQGWIQIFLWVTAFSRDLVLTVIPLMGPGQSAGGWVAREQSQQQL